MASHSNEEYLHITSEAYQEVVRHAAHDYSWSQYFLLVDACFENLKHMPTTSGQYSQASAENLLVDALERLATAIAILLPGGIDEFQSYIVEAAYRYKLSEDTTLKKIQAAK